MGVQGKSKDIVSSISVTRISINIADDDCRLMQSREGVNRSHHVDKSPRWHNERGRIGCGRGSGECSSNVSDNRIYFPANPSGSGSKTAGPMNVKPDSIRGIFIKSVWQLKLKFKPLSHSLQESVSLHCSSECRRRGRIHSRPD